MSGATSGRLALAVALAVTLAGPPAAAAQDFASPWAPGDGGAALLIEQGLPSAGAGASLEFLAVRWLGLDALATRAVAFAAGWRSARLGAGLSQTGDAELGWTAAAFAAGVGREDAGAALRVVGRQNRAWAGAGRPAPDVEAGAGAWLVPTPGFGVWASAPALWSGPSPPPLARGLTLGARVDGGDLSAWFARESVRLGAGDALSAAHRAGIRWRAGAIAASLEALDGPLRGALALAARAGPLEVSARVESHPVAGETTNLAVRLVRGGPP